MRAAVVTVSSSLARGEGEDVSGARLADLCREAGLEVSHETVADNREAIARVLMRLADQEGVRFVFGNAFLRSVLLKQSLRVVGVREHVGPRLGPQHGDHRPQVLLGQLKPRS